MFKNLAEHGIWPFTWIYYRKQLNAAVREASALRPKPLVPMFEDPAKLEDGEFFYNPDFYVTKETAMEVRNRFNALVAFQMPVMDGEKWAPSQWFIRFADGLEINAGAIAKFFAQYPEETFPGIAPRFGISLIAHERGMKEARRRRAQEEQRVEE